MLYLHVCIVQCLTEDINFCIYVKTIICAVILGLKNVKAVLYTL